MTTIKLKNGSGAPIAADLVQGEPALDLTNKRLYTEDSSGTIIEIGTKPTELNVTNNIVVGGTVDGRNVSEDGAKLDGIEAGADVTDTINVTAAGALMDSEVTNLAQVKAFDSSDYATAAQGSLADTALQGNETITLTGAVTGSGTTSITTTLSTIDGGTY